MLEAVSADLRLVIVAMRPVVSAGRWLVAADTVVGMAGPWEDAMSVVRDVPTRPEGLEIEIVPGGGVLEVESVSEEAEGRNVFGGDVTRLGVIDVAMLDVEIVTMLTDDVVGVV